MISIKKKIYITLLCFAIVFGILIKFGTLPSIETLKRNSQALSLQKRALNLFQNQVEDLKDFQKEFSQYQAILEKVNHSFVAREAPINFIEFLEREAQNLNLPIEISPLNITQKKTDPWVPVAFSISFAGTFPDCLRFLERLEQSSWLIEISQLNVERISEEKTGDVSFSLTFKAFSL